MLEKIEAARIEMRADRCLISTLQTMGRNGEEQLEFQLLVGRGAHSSALIPSTRHKNMPVTHQGLSGYIFLSRCNRM